MTCDNHTCVDVVVVMCVSIMRMSIHTLAHDFRLAGHSGDLYTVFHVREAKYEVDKRIEQARMPLQRKAVSEDVCVMSMCRSVHV